MIVMKAHHLQIGFYLLPFTVGAIDLHCIQSPDSYFDWARGW